MMESKEILRLHKKLIRSKKHPFPEKGKVKITDEHGIYIIYSNEDEALHVGSTKYGKRGLNQRLTNHINKSSVFHREYITKRTIELRHEHFFRYIEVPCPRKRALLEALTAGLLCLVHFGTGLKRTNKLNHE